GEVEGAVAYLDPFPMEGGGWLHASTVREHREDAADIPGAGLPVDIDEPELAARLRPERGLPKANQVRMAVGRPLGTQGRQQRGVRHAPFLVFGQASLRRLAQSPA